jgi:hypothetical protein
MLVLLLVAVFKKPVDTKKSVFSNSVGFQKKPAEFGKNQLKSI